MNLENLGNSEKNFSGILCGEENFAEAGEETENFQVELDSEIEDGFLKPKSQFCYSGLLMKSKQSVNFSPKKIFSPEFFFRPKIFRPEVFRQKVFPSESFPSAPSVRARPRPSAYPRSGLTGGVRGGAGAPTGPSEKVCLVVAPSKMCRRIQNRHGHMKEIHTIEIEILSVESANFGIQKCHQQLRAGSKKTFKNVLSRSMQAAKKTSKMS